MALVTVAGSDVISGRIHMSARGAWWAELKLDTQTAPSGKATIAAANGISLAGFVAKAGLFIGVTHVKLVGGAGGLSTEVPAAAYQNALLRDPLSAILQASGESQSSSISSSVLGASLTSWSAISSNAGQQLDELCYAAAAAIGQPCNWRVLSDGTVWIGAETWPSQSLPAGTDVVNQLPLGGRFELGCETPAIVPGVNISDINANVLGVDHWIEADKIRTELWTSLAT